MSGILADEMMGGKVLVFAHHKNVLDALEIGVLRRGGIEFIRIDGRTKVRYQGDRSGCNMKYVNSAGFVLNTSRVNPKVIFYCFKCRGSNNTIWIVDGMLLNLK